MIASEGTNLPVPPLEAPVDIQSKGALIAKKPTKVIKQISYW